MNTQDSANAIRQLAIQYQSMVTAAEVLEQIGSLDNAIKEANQRLADANAEAEAARVALDKVKAELVATTEQAATIKNEASDTSSGIIADAKQSAQAIMDNANRQAAQTIANAQAVAESKVNAVADQIAALETRKAAVEGEIAALDEAAAASRDAADIAAKQLVKIKDSITKLASV